MGDDDYYTVLQQEFAWDRAAFTRVTNAMLACCRAYDEVNQPPTLFGQAYETTHLPRWLAYVFWEVATVLAGQAPSAIQPGRKSSRPTQIITTGLMNACATWLTGSSRGAVSIRTLPSTSPRCNLPAALARFPNP
jgi:hypothetical protein